MLKELGIGAEPAGERVGARNKGDARGGRGVRAVRGEKNSPDGVYTQYDPTKRHVRAFVTPMLPESRDRGHL